MYLIVISCSFLFLQITSADEVSFLMKFGYLPNIPNALLSADVQDLAIRKFQKAYGLPMTGHIDDQTRNAMNEPRCSLPDFDNRKRKKRGSLIGYKNQKITYGVKRWSRRLSQQEVEIVLRKAFDVWENEADLTFSKAENPLITVDFGIRDHTCPFHFDSTVLAHAFMPTDPVTDITGDVHFNEEFVWTTAQHSSQNGVSLLSVAIHEIGHAIGLTHNTDEPDSIMSPRDQHRKTRITERDRYYLQRLYGSPKSKYSSSSENKVHPTGTVGQDRDRNHYHVDTIKPNPCNTNIDAIGSLRGNLIIFKDEWTWVFTRDGRLFREPELITTTIPQLPYPVDAILEVDDDLWAFVDAEIYVLHMTQQGLRIKHAPYKLAYFGVDPNIKRIDVAHEWYYDPYHWFYIWSGDQYWKINVRSRQVEATYPRKVFNGWPNVPYKVSSAFTHEGELHFIKDRFVYKMNSSDFRLPIAKQYPIPISHFFKSCPTEETNIKSNHLYRCIFNYSLIIIIFLLNL